MNYYQVDFDNHKHPEFWELDKIGAYSFLARYVNIISEDIITECDYRKSSKGLPPAANHKKLQEISKEQFECLWDLYKRRRYIYK